MLDSVFVSIDLQQSARNKEGSWYLSGTQSSSEKPWSNAAQAQKGDRSI
jgi:hypothetical protein